MTIQYIMTTLSLVSLIFFIVGMVMTLLVLILEMISSYRQKRHLFVDSYNNLNKKSVALIFLLIIVVVSFYIYINY